MAIGFALAVHLPSSGEVPEQDPELRRGIKLVEQGEYGQAIIALDPVARRFDASAAARPHAAQANLYLGMAYVGEGQEALARASFRKALDRNPNLELSAFDVSPKVRELFEMVREERQAITRGPALSASPPPKGRSNRGLVLVVAGGATAAGLALALGGDGSSGTATTEPSPPAAVPVSGSGGPWEITLTGTTPAAGAAVSVSGGTAALTVVARNASAVRVAFEGKLVDPASLTCFTGVAVPNQFPLEPGETRSFTQTLDLTLLRARCAPLPPVATLWLDIWDQARSNLLYRISFGDYYRLNP